MAEGARLESVCRIISYRGFESPSLRQKREKAPMNGAFSICLPTFLPTWRLRRFQLFIFKLLA